jgi:hypothetical protein
MIAEPVPFGSEVYLIFLGLLLFSRATDFLSTWVATPNLLLEANPIAKRLGWRWGIPLNMMLCAVFAMWPLPAVIISTTSVLVAARNFQSAWIIRSIGEGAYKLWINDRLGDTPLPLFFFCLFAQGLLVAGVGGVLVGFSGLTLVPLGIGLGLMGYAAAVVLYTSISVWRNRRSAR